VVRKLKAEALPGTAFVYINGSKVKEREETNWVVFV